VSKQKKTGGILQQKKLNNRGESYAKNISFAGSLSVSLLLEGLS
jgi:hypothetical protein